MKILVSSSKLKYTPVFCYGSNNPAQLKERIGGRNFEKVQCYANGYKRIFCGYSRKWGGGVASIKKTRNKTVYGYLAYLTDEELNILDMYEGVPTVYQRQNITVMSKGESIEAIAYIKNDCSQFNAPSESYLEAIVKTIGSFWTNADGSKITIDDITIA